MGLSAGEDGHWWLVRVDAISFEDTAWSPQLAHRIRTRVRWDREQEVLRQLAERLAGRWPVAVDEQALNEARRDVALS